MKIGIHDIAASTGSYVFELADLANERGVDPAKFEKGLGQSQMSINSPDEDIVTLGAEAAKKIIDRHGTENIRTIIFATESGVDQSKAAGVFMHGLLNLPGNCRVVEVKEACYSATAALQFAAGMIVRNPTDKVLIIASDAARYELNSSGEPTQGSGAIAMLVTKDPALFEFEPVSGLWTSDVMDFWRPNDRSTALVDGHYSMQIYLDSLQRSWQDYESRGGYSFNEIDYICYHQPFTKMAVKAHKCLAELCGENEFDKLLHTLEPTMVYNRRLGNTYTASVFFALLSLLDNAENLTGKRVGLFSYGSGAVSEFFCGIVPEGYATHLRREENVKMLDERKRVDYEYYENRHSTYDRTGEYSNELETSSGFRFKGVTENKREYEAL